MGQQRFARDCRGATEPIVVVLLLVIGLLIAGFVGVYLRRMATDDMDEVGRNQGQVREELETRLAVSTAFGTADASGPRGNPFCAGGKCQADDASLRLILVVRNTGERTVTPAAYDKLKVYLNNVPLSNHTQYRFDYSIALLKGSTMNLPLNVTCGEVGSAPEHVAVIKLEPGKGEPAVSSPVTCEDCCGGVAAGQERCLTRC